MKDEKSPYRSPWTIEHSQSFTGVFSGKGPASQGDKFRAPPQGPLLRRQFGQIYALRVDAPWCGKSVNLMAEDLEIWRWKSEEILTCKGETKTRGIPDMEVVFVCWPIYYISMFIIYVYIYNYNMYVVYHCHLVPIFWGSTHPHPKHRKCPRVFVNSQVEHMM